MRWDLLALNCPPAAWQPLLSCPRGARYDQVMSCFHTCQVECEIWSLGDGLQRNGCCVCES